MSSCGYLRGFPGGLPPWLVVLHVFLRSCQSPVRMWLVNSLLLQYIEAGQPSTMHAANNVVQRAAPGGLRPRRMAPSDQGRQRPAALTSTLHSVRRRLLPRHSILQD